MNTSSKAFWPLVAAVSLGVGFVGYCIYFDQKRRNAPDFRAKLKAKRKQRTTSTSGNLSIDSSNPEDMRRIFLEQIQQGEDCLSRGDLDNGVDHLGKAVALCSQPESLLSLLQETLPPELFQEMIVRLPQIAQSMIRTSSSSTLGDDTFSYEPDLE